MPPSAIQRTACSAQWIFAWAKRSGSSTEHLSSFAATIQACRCVRGHAESCRGGWLPAALTALLVVRARKSKHECAQKYAQALGCGTNDVH